MAMITGNKKGGKMQGKRKAYIMSLATVSLAVLLSFTGVFSQVKQAEAAGNTLDGISKIVSSNNVNNKFNVLEIVPDYAATVSMSEVSGGQLSVSMGTIGWLVSGNEPVKLQETLSQFQSTQARTDFINNLKTALTDICTTASNNSKPLQYTDYQEKLEDMLSDAEKTDGTWTPLISTSANRLSGISMNQITVQPASGNYIKRYSTTSANGASDNSAYDFFKNNGTSSLFERSDGQGDFQPGFSVYTDPDTDTTLGRYDACFEATDAKRCGYVVESTKEITIGTSRSWDDFVTDNAAGWTGESLLGLYVYKSDGNKLTFAGKIIKDDAGEVSLSVNCINTAKAVMDFDMPVMAASGNSTPSVNATGSGNETPPSETNTASGENITEETVSGEETLSLPVLSLGAPAPKKGTDGTYYYVSFKYEERFDGTDANEQYYQVKKFARNDVSGNFAVLKDQQLVPDLAKTGPIAVKSDAYGCIQYTYTKGYGNYSAQTCTDPSVTLYETGARIYYHGGFKNNDWFKQYVFDRDQTAEFEKLYINIQTVKAKDVTADMVKNAGLIYVSNAKGLYLPYKNAAYEVYGTENDISHDVLKSILYYVSERNKPVVMDYSLYTDTSDATFIGKLAHALVSDNIKDAYARFVSYSDISGLTYKKITADTDHTYADKSVYIFNDFNHSNDGLPLLNGNFNAIANDTAVSGGFSDVLTQIRSENSSRAADKKIIEYVYEGNIIRYIIDYAQQNTVDAKGDLSILEIEPTALDASNGSVTLKYDLSVSANGDKDNPQSWLIYKKWDSTTNGTNVDEKVLLHTYGNIAVDQMSVQEFIGKVTDLNSKYDMIFVGDDTSGMNHVVAGNMTSDTAYNDYNMRGLIYSNIGDYSYMIHYLLGSYDSDYTDAGYKGDANYLKSYDAYSNESKGAIGRFRYSGNDLLKADVDKILDYARADYPVVFADKLVNTNNSKFTANEKYVDNSSYLYELINDLGADAGAGDNVFTVSQLLSNSKTTNELFAQGLNSLKPKLNVTSPDTHSSVTTVNGAYMMDIKFSITDEGTGEESNYTVNTYIDQNADGKYASSEKLDAVTVYLAGTTETVDSTSLSVGTQYELKRQLPGSAGGVYPWKVETVQNTNSKRRDCVIGYYTVKRAEKQKIKVLQIMTAASSEHNTNTLNIQEKMGSNPYTDGAQSAMGYYLNNIDDYQLDVTSVTSDKYIYSDDYVTDKTADGFLNNMQDYDMIIVGFADQFCWGDSKSSEHIKLENNAAEGLLEYIAQGNSVLFSHDCTSYYNVANSTEKDKDQWGFQFNQYVRDVVGLNRYGIYTNAKDCDNTAVKQLLSGQEQYNNTAYAPRSGRKISLSDIEGQGMTYFWMDKRRADTGYWKKDNANDSTAYFYSRLVNYAYNFDKVTTSTTVTKVNDGQITQYPYVLSDEFNVNMTHAQYYQLNLNIDDDQDGESDVVVWYCLGNQNKTSGTDKIFAYSKNDVLNNYFIYSRGNVTYSGQGHRSFNEDYDGISSSTEGAAEIAPDANESKLFVNTIIAAYTPGIHKPKAYVRETGSLKSREIKSLVLPYDPVIDSNSGKAAGTDISEFPGVSSDAATGTGNMSFYFEAEDLNIVDSKSIYAKFYYYDPVNGQTDADGALDGKVSELAVSSIVPVNEDGTEGAAITPGTNGWYGLFHSPLATGETQNRLFKVVFSVNQVLGVKQTDENGVAVNQPSNTPEIYIKLRSDVIKLHGSTTVRSVYGEGSLTLLRTQLFELK